MLGMVVDDALPRETPIVGMSPNMPALKLVWDEMVVDVSDAEAPVITCPANIAINTDPTVNTAAVTFLDATATDNNGVFSVTQIAGLTSGSAFPLGVNTVTYEAIDLAPASNNSTCNFTVTVTDAEAPCVTTTPARLGPDLPATALVGQDFHLQVTSSFAQRTPGGC